jgi:hypothetical protein
MRDSRWVVTRDEDYQGRRVHGIEVEEVHASLNHLDCKTMWFRFADAQGGTAWRCWVYDDRLDAIVNRTEQSLDQSVEVQKAVYKKPLEMTLNFHYGLQLKIKDMGSQPFPWEGEVFSCVHTASPSEEK